MMLLLSALSIFALRILDVSIGTLRIAMLVRGRRLLAGIFSFFESLVWLVAAAQVLTSLDNPLQFVAYAGGYAAGTMLGATLERWLAVGDTMLRVVSQVDSPSPGEALRQAGYFATIVNAEGRDGEVRITFSVVPRKRIPRILRLIKDTNPQAYVTLDETTPVNMAKLSAAKLRK